MSYGLDHVYRFCWLAVLMITPTIYSGDTCAAPHANAPEIAQAGQGGKRVEYITCPVCNGRGADFLVILRCESCQGSGQYLVDRSDESMPF